MAGEPVGGLERESPRRAYVLYEIGFELLDSGYSKEWLTLVRVFLRQERAQEARCQAEREHLRVMVREGCNLFNYRDDPVDWSEVISLETPIWCDYLKENGIDPPEGVEGWRTTKSVYLMGRLAGWYDLHRGSWSPEQVHAILETVLGDHYRVVEADLDE